MSRATVGITSALRAQVIEAYLERLQRAGNPIAASPEPRAQAIAQANSVLDDLLSDVAELPSPAMIAASLEIGSDRAMEGIHPVESVRAAGELYEAALPLVLAAAREQRGEEFGLADVASVAGVLSRAVSSRIATGAVRYVGYLQEQLHNSHLSERQRVARELHDRTAHTIGVALTSLELFEALEDTDPERARRKLVLAGESMRSALSDVRRFALELRQSVEPDNFEQALRDYVEATAGTGVQWSVTVTGKPCLLPASLSQELFVLVREAVRNALVHSGTAELEVTVEITESAVNAQVRDTGSGFEVDGEHRPGSMGLFSMRERAQLLAGRLTVESAPGAGTTATISVPLGRVQV